MLRTIKTNWRDITAFLLVAVLACVALDLLNSWSARLDAEGRSVPGLAAFISLLTGFARFTAANACAWLLGMAVAWPTFNRWGNCADTFCATWNRLGDAAKMSIYVAVAATELIAAAICFCL